VWSLPAVDANERLRQLFTKLGDQQFTNVLVEGGATLLGSLFDLELVDEVHAFIAPKLIGGAGAPSALTGTGLSHMDQASGLDSPSIELLGPDIYVHGRVRRM
jgi:diaminohydroxyphosphoribosylaminopyrimidine deaminase/5-amino-6-(5-phosphoribosylamino)uracil reductase